MMFGGVFDTFGSWNQMESTMHDLLSLLRSDLDWRRQQSTPAASLWA